MGGFWETNESQIQQYRSSHQRCSVKKRVLRNFAKFTGKHLCPRLFFNKVAGLRLNLENLKNLWSNSKTVNSRLNYRAYRVNQLWYTLPVNSCSAESLDAIKFYRICRQFFQKVEYIDLWRSMICFHHVFACLV